MLVGVRTVGVEEELLVVDPSGRPVPLGPAALEVAARHGEGETVEEHDRAERGDDEAGGGDPVGRLVPELKTQQLEFGTRVCTGLDDVAADLRHWRGRADAAARDVGARVAALASSPVRVEPQSTPGERYTEMAETFGLTAAEQLTCGCHVHVAVEDDEEGVAVLNRIRVWLPVLTALTANSPFWLGRDSGHASYRAQAWNRWPSSGPNELFADAATYHRLVQDLLATETIVDTGMVYFDARLSERWPTVEVRVADVALRAEDAVTLAGYRSLPEVARYQTWDSYTEREATAMIEELESLQPGTPGEWFQFAIELKKTGALIGDCALKAEEDGRQAEVGFTLSREHQGKGYASEAVSRLLDYAFGDLGLHRVVAITDQENEPSFTLLERLGMRREGCFVQNAWFKGRWTSEYLYAVLEDEWSRKPRV